ncbi:hypothetical protein CDD81_6507 [Ophiocordyceps australis]|uniref:CENP-C homolog n=1 Tax=Ophiocordyceps australis TaxID=1399860 RepID=A0A2C5YGQ7_9HYPO|nr:hypothetical protein CDD81_6507 [Ophiocordyceps australis]
MAPRAKRGDTDAPQAFHELGVRGRKTGVSLPEGGERDEHGMQHLDGIFSPADARPTNGAADSEGEDMDIDSSAGPGPWTMLQNQRSRLSIPKSRSPIKTKLNSPARRMPPAEAQSAQRSAASDDQPLSRKLDFGSKAKPAAKDPHGVNGAARDSRREADQDAHVEVSGMEEESLFLVDASTENLDQSTGRVEVPKRGGMEEEEEEEEDEDVVVPAPRRRGRPRKNPEPAPKAKPETETVPKKRPTAQSSGGSSNNQSRPEARLQDQDEEEPRQAKRKRTQEASQEAPKAAPQPARKRVSQEAPKAAVREAPKPSARETSKQVAREAPKPAAREAPKQVARAASPATTASAASSSSPPPQPSPKRAQAPATGKPQARPRGRPASRAQPRPDEANNNNDDDDDDERESSFTQLQRGPPMPKSRGLVSLRRNPDAMTQTRSGRHSFRPLDYWRGEVIVRQDEQRSDMFHSDAFVLPSVKEIVRVPPDAPPAKRSAGGAASSKPSRKPKPAAARQTPELEDWEIDPGTVTGEVVVWEPEHEAHPPADDEPVQVMDDRIAIAANAIRTSDIKDATFRFAKTLTTPFMGAGVVDLPPSSEKRPKNSRKMHMVFFVHLGKVLVTINDAQFRISAGGTWFVPRGNYYSVTNDYDVPARIFFAQACEAQASPQASAQDSQLAPDDSQLSVPQS